MSDAELTVEIERLRNALRMIAEFEPVADVREITHDPEACEDCQSWKRRKHPIQSACDVWVREFYRREDDRKHAESTQHYGMRRIAQDALAPQPSNS